MPRGGGIAVVLVTCPTKAAARRIAGELVRKRLAACVNLVPGLTSVYRWQGRVERAREVLLVVKTTRGRLASLTRAVLAAHPYDVPEIVALQVIWGHRPYLAWVAGAC
jgi:periplasmic divalent cation tolerance protein